ncbi:hypothetical protein EJ08DRAFT_709818 [Tothia fuscella]|uniref:Uncharacterized protein n=1 Tax=Tothia fuscella TaxID=1048955 RepID=A0A9P4U094_9PEZI|nr:hypothetical protein EJ08DRAFT_709818 [Tothia fuscella]
MLVYILGLVTIAHALTDCTNSQINAPLDQLPFVNVRYALSCTTTTQRGSGNEIIDGINITLTGISDKFVEKFKSSLPLALELAKRASEATAANEFPDIFEAYFKTSDERIRKNVANRYAAMAKHLSSIKN